MTEKDNEITEKTEATEVTKVTKASKASKAQAPEVTPEAIEAAKALLLKAQEAEPKLAPEPAQEAPGPSPEDYLEERVPVILFKDNDKYKDDVAVSVNGETIQIQRGVQVMVKRKHMLVIESQYRQQVISAEVQDRLADEYAANSKKRGLE